MAFAPSELGFSPASNGHIDLFPPSGQRSLGYELIPADPAWMLPFHPVYRRGEGIPRGDGSPIIFVPGLFSSDGYMRPMKNWVNRRGYAGEDSNIIWNVGSWRLHLQRLKESTRRVIERTGRKATIIGHSLGGVYGLAEVFEDPDLVDTLITLASDTKENIRKAAHPAVGWGGSFAINIDPETEEMLDLLPTLPLPAGVKMYCIFGDTDGVFHQESFGDPRAEENIQIPGKHFSLPFNPYAYEHIGRIQGEKVERLRNAGEEKILQFPISRVA